VNRYLFEYTHDGADWGIEILADSPADARARIAKLAFARYQGEVMFTVPARAGWLVRPLVWLRNAVRKALS